MYNGGQGGSSGLVVNRYALPGRVPQKLDIDVEGEVLPAQLAAQHAATYPNNLHPVSPAPPCPPTYCSIAVTQFLHMHASVKQDTLGACAVADLAVFGCQV